jgi:hypothetical protein
MDGHLTYKILWPTDIQDTLAYLTFRTLVAPDL